MSAEILLGTVIYSWLRCMPISASADKRHSLPCQCWQVQGYAVRNNALQVSQAEHLCPQRWKKKAKSGAYRWVFLSTQRTVCAKEELAALVGKAIECLTGQIIQKCTFFKRY